MSLLSKFENFEFSHREMSIIDDLVIRRTMLIEINKFVINRYVIMGMIPMQIQQKII